MDREDLFGLMEFYLLNDIIKKRTSINGNTYFFVKDKDPQGGDLLSFAYYTSQDKTLHLYPYWFTGSKKIRSIPTYKGGGLYATINDESILDLVYEWFQDKFPELNIRRMREMKEYLFDLDVESMERFDEDYVDIHSSISEDVKRIKELLK
jgi:hypothetical protein